MGALPTWRWSAPLRRRRRSLTREHLYARLEPACCLRIVDGIRCRQALQSRTSIDRPAQSKSAKNKNKGRANLLAKQHSFISQRRITSCIWQHHHPQRRSSIRGPSVPQRHPQTALPAPAAGGFGRLRDLRCPASILHGVCRRRKTHLLPPHAIKTNDDLIVYSPANIISPPSKHLHGVANQQKL